MKSELNQAYLKQIKPIYKKAKKSEKKELLDHAEQVTALSRKRIIRILNGNVTPDPSHLSIEYPKEHFPLRISYVYCSF